LESSKENVLTWLGEGAVSVLVCSTDKVKENLVQVKEYLKNLAESADGEELAESVLSVLGPW
jgi:hypothetical protein